MMNKNILKSIFALSVLLLLSGITANASTSDEVMNDYYYKMYGSAYNNFNTPYTAVETDGDVEEKTASVVVNATDYVINGKNGLAIPLTRTFGSDTSTEADYYEKDRSSAYEDPVWYRSQYVCSVDGEIISVKLNNEREVFEAGNTFEGVMYNDDEQYFISLKREGTGIFYTKRYPDTDPTLVYEKSGFSKNKAGIFNTKAFLMLGKGWVVPKASMIMYDYYHEDDKWEVYEIFQDIYGNSTTFYLRYDEDNTVTRLESATCSDEIAYSKYKASAVDNGDISQTATHPNGCVYNFTVTSDDGMVYYFNREGYREYTLLCVSDKYGNSLMIDSSVILDNEYYEITTDEGISYKCTSDGITKNCDGVVTELVSYELETVNSERDTANKYSIDDEYIFNVIKNSGTENEISDNENNITRYFMKQEYCYENMLSSGNYLIYRLPYKMIMPSGLERYFEYTEYYDWVMGDPNGTQDGNYYVVSRCYDKSGDTIRNDRYFTYEREKESKNYYAHYYFKNSTENHMSSSGIFRTLINTFDKKSRLTSYTLKRSDTQYDKYTYSYKSAHANSPVSSENFERYNSYSNSVTHTKNYEYIKDMPTKETNGDYICDYTHYEDNYYIPHTTTYKKDANTTVKTENILTEDGKSIATQNVYENDILKSTVHFTYDSYGNVVSKTIPIDENNSAVTTYAYTYNADGGYTITTTQTGITDADGNALDDIVTTTTYDSQNNIISQTDANGNTTTMTYDLLNRPLTISYPDGTSESYEYDMANNVTTYTGKDGEIKKAYFDKWGNKSRICAISDGEELLLEKYKYDTFGNMNYYYRYYDNSNYTRVFYSYDYLSRPVREIVRKNGDEMLRDTIYSYSISSDSNSRPLYTTKATVSGDSGTYATQSQTTDYMGNVTEKKIFTDEEERIYTYTYDYVGNMLSETNPAGQTIATTYDYLNRPVTVTDAAGSVKTFEYNALDLVSRESDFNGNFATYTYDNAGRLITKISPFDADDNAVSHMYYDPNGNVIQTKTKSNISGNADEYQTADSAYDSMNRLSYTAVHPTSGTSIYTQYEYTALGLPERVVYGLTSLIEPGADVPDEASSVSYEYDDLGRLKKLYDGLGEDETYTYDFQGRLRVKQDKMSRLTTYTYDNFDNIIRTKNGDIDITTTYNILGQRTSMTDSTGTTTYTYNPFGELTTETKGDIIKSYSYDNLSNRTSFDITSNSSQIMSLTYAYDSLSRLTSVTDGTDTASYTYDANSNELSASLNGEVYKNSEYNYANLPTTVYYPNTGDSTNRIIYTYRVNGNMHSHKDWLDYTSARIYTYDGAGRVTMDMSMLDDDLYRDDFSYDTRGNIVSVEHRDRSVSPNVITTTAYTYDKANKLISSTDGTDTTAYSYDGLGNMTSVTKNGEQIKAYTYDRLNRLLSSTVNGTTASYTYDGDNLRQTKTSNDVTTQHILDGMNVVVDIKNNDINTYTRGNGLVFSKNLSTGNRTVYNTYSKGDVAQLVNPDGTFDEYTYGAYGKITYNSTDNSNPFTYCGEYTDTETGLVYLRNRYYDPELGIFLTQDPAKDGFNWYAYCAGDPVNSVDPWGLYEPGDEKLPYLINYIINGADGKTGGLTALYNNTTDPEEQARIAKVADMLRCETTDYDITKTSAVTLLLDENGAIGHGHMAIIIQNDEDQGVYFSYAAEDRMPIDSGVMNMDILSKSEMEEFFRSGNLYFTYASNGTLASSNYTKYATINIDSANGSSMIGRGIDYFQNPGLYFILSHEIGIGRQCDVVTSSIMDAGGIGYEVKWRPKASFNHTVNNLNLQERSFE